MAGKDPFEVRWTFERGLAPIVAETSPRRSFATMNDVWLAPDAFGAIQSMPGYSAINSAIANTPTFHGTALAVSSGGTRLNLFSYEEAGGNEFIVSMSPAGTPTTIISTATSPAITVPDFSAVVLEDKVFFANGTDAGAKYNFSALSASGVARPDDDAGWPPTVSASAGGDNNVKGIVSYYLSGVTGTTEGALSSELGPISCGDGSRGLLGLNVLPANTYRIYRTLADRSQPFYVAEVTGGSDYTDDTPDDNLQDYPDLHGDPPLAAIISQVAFNNRIWGWTQAGLLLWTDPEEPESWWNSTLGNQAPINQNDGDLGTVLIRIPGAFLACKENHIYRVLGNTPSNLQIQESAVATQEGRTVGIPSQQAVTPIGDAGLAFYWNRGIYILSGGFPQYISQNIEDDLAVIRNQDEADGVFLGYFPKRRHLYVSVPLSAGTAPTHTYIYDVDNGQWIGRRTVGFRGFLSTEDANGNEEFWAAAPGTAGIIYKMEDGQTEAGTAMTPSITFPAFYGRNRNSLKRLLYVDIEYEPVASGSLSWSLAQNGRSTGAETGSFSMVSANHDRQVTRINVRSNQMCHEAALTLSSSADQPQWLIHSLTWGWHEYGSISR